MVKEMAMIAITSISTFFGFNPNIIESLTQEAHPTVEFASKKIELTTGDYEQVDTLISHLEYVEEYLDDLEVSFKIISIDDMVEISEEKGIPTFGGMYSTKSKEIKVVGYDKEGSVHETGHAVYFQKLTEAEKEEIDGLFEIDAENLLDKYGTSSVKEFFAVAFTEFIYMPERLQQECPQTFKFMTNMKEAKFI